MSVLDELTIDQKKALAKLALDKASELGYCSDAKAVIEGMGLVDSSDMRVSKRVVLEVEITVDYGTDIQDYNFEVGYEDYDSDPETGNVTLISMEDIT